ncbi:MAG: fluoride efflux transporter CrcB [Hyphomicrobiales bacterium]|nr:fluoride efflux transporter CrcB [Hyphomicrobiales bacterium]
MQHLLVVAAGGAAGAALRHLVNLWTLRALGPGFPWGTLTVNLLGSLMMGVFIELLALKFQGSTNLRLLVATGMLGGFTTFSAFSLDLVVMIERGATATAAAYIGTSVIGGVIGLFLGLRLVRMVLV